MQVQATRVAHPPDEVTSIAVGDDLAHVLPAELALLGDPATRGPLLPAAGREAPDCLRARRPRAAGPRSDHCGHRQQRLDGRGRRSAGQGGRAGAARHRRQAAARPRRPPLRRHAPGAARSSASRAARPPRRTSSPARRHFYGGGTAFEPWMRAALRLIDEAAFDRADVIAISRRAGPRSTRPSGRLAAPPPRARDALLRRPDRHARGGRPPGRHQRRAPDARRPGRRRPGAPDHLRDLAPPAAPSTGGAVARAGVMVAPAAPRHARHEGGHHHDQHRPRSRRRDPRPAPGRLPVQLRLERRPRRPVGAAAGLAAAGLGQLRAAGGLPPGQPAPRHPRLDRRARRRRRARRARQPGRPGGRGRARAAARRPARWCGWRAPAARLDPVRRRRRGDRPGRARHGLPHRPARAGPQADRRADRHHRGGRRHRRPGPGPGRGAADRPAAAAALGALPATCTPPATWAR